MKAEHRKELQTNVLADRVGRLVQQIKQRPKRRVLLYVIGGGVILIALFFFVRFRQTAARERSDQWVMLEDGFKPYIDDLRSKSPETNAGKAARFQYAWLATWDLGLKILGSDPVRALENLEVGESIYKQLSKDCEGDPVWEPEALYGLAVIEETRAIRQKDRSKHLENALALYKKLVNNYKNSAHAKMAQKRVEALAQRGEEVANFYADLQSRLKVPEERPPELKMPKNK